MENNQQVELIITWQNALSMTGADEGLHTWGMSDMQC